MKIILLKDIPKLGKRHDVKDVSSGHAQNLLIPHGDAIPATPEALKRTEKLRMQAEAERKIREDLLMKNLKDLDGATIAVSGKANDKGHLFAGLHRDAIAAEVQKQTELQVDPAMIALDQPVKEVGEHTIEVKAEGTSVTFKLVVTAL